MLVLGILALITITAVYLLFPFTVDIPAMIAQPLRLQPIVRDHTPSRTTGPYV